MSDTNYSEMKHDMDDILDENIAKYKRKKPALKALGIGAGVIAATGLGILAANHYNQVPSIDEELYVEGQFLVEFEDDFTVDSVDRLNDKLEGETYEHIIGNWYLVDIDDSLDEEQWMERFARAKSVEAVSYDMVMSIDDSYVPEDPYFHSEGSWDQDYRDMWGLWDSGALEAWELSTGSEDVVVAVLDTGIAHDIPDLENMMWRNPGETLDGIDNDGDGAIDNIFGINTVNPDATTYDGHGHGSHVAGTIAAEHNEIGVAGVNAQAQLMAVKVLSDSGSGSMSGIAQGIKWAADHDADVINMSLGGRSFGRSAVDEAIEYATKKGTIIVVAAGNNDGDAKHITPANHPDVITVAALEPDGNRTDFSNWGEKVDVAAPGRGILSTVPEKHSIPTSRYWCTKAEDGKTNYCELAGTSMASPHVAGEVALILSVRPDLRGDTEAVREIIREGVTEFPRDQDKPIGTGRINFGLALLEALNND